MLNPNTATPPKSPYSPSTAHAGAAADIADLHKIVLDRKNIAAKTTDIIAVYTDIDMPTDQRLVEVEGGAKNKNDFVVYDENATDGAVDKSSYIRLSAADTAKLESQHEGGVPMPSLVISQAGTTTTTFSGNYKGVPGTFTCATATCMGITAEAMLDDTALDYNKDGTLKVELIGFVADNDWYFEPDNPAVTTSVQDANYLWFGWWHVVPEKPGERNDRNDHGVNVFFGGSQPFTTGEEDAENTFMQLVEGDATYSGSAAGKYVQEGGPRANPDFTGDAFTATATLTASFGDGDNANEGDNASSDNDDGLGSIEGSITGFVNGQGEVLDWKVTLNPIALTAGANTFETLEAIAETDDDNAVAEIAGGESDMGTWSGRFFGNNREDGQPGSVAGRFETYFGTANPATEPDDVHTAIHGAFGATNTSPDE